MADIQYNSVQQNINVSWKLLPNGKDPFSVPVPGTLPLLLKILALCAVSVWFLLCDPIGRKSLYKTLFSSNDSKAQNKNRKSSFVPWAFWTF